MSWRNHPVAADEETALLIEIAVDFLVMYFGHDRSDASEMMATFLDKYAQYYDEDTIHRQLPYRMAAFVHYVVAMNGKYESAYEWLVNSEHNEMPYEAREYYSKKYYTYYDE